jgi:hypothetical protein
MVRLQLGVVGRRTHGERHGEDVDHAPERVDHHRDEHADEEQQERVVEQLLDQRHLAGRVVVGHGRSPGCKTMARLFRERGGGDLICDKNRRCRRCGRGGVPRRGR